MKSRTHLFESVKSGVCLLAVIALTIPTMADGIPPTPSRIINKYCIDCHNADVNEGNVNLSSKDIDWTLEDSRKLWESVLRVNDQQIMPPAAESQPSEAERAELTAWLDKQLHTAQ